MKTEIIPVVLFSAVCFAGISPFEELPPPSEAEIEAGRQYEESIRSAFDLDELSTSVEQYILKHPKESIRLKGKLVTKDVSQLSIGRGWKLEDPRWRYMMNNGWVLSITENKGLLSYHYSQELSYVVHLKGSEGSLKPINAELRIEEEI